MSVGRVGSELTRAFESFRFGASRHLSQLPSDRFGWMIKPKPKLDCSMILQERQPYFIQVRDERAEPPKRLPDWCPLWREWGGMAFFPLWGDLRPNRPLLVGRLIPSECSSMSPVPCISAPVGWRLCCCSPAN